MAKEFNDQILAHQERQILAQARKRANSEATEVPDDDGNLDFEIGGFPTEKFDKEIDYGGFRFTTVKYFHPRQRAFHHFLSVFV